MKKIIFFIFFPSLCFADGTISINTSTGSGGIIAIQGNPVSTATGSGTPSGPNTAVQFSSNNTFGGDIGFQYDRTVSSVTIKGDLSLGDILGGSNGTLNYRSTSGSSRINMNGPFGGSNVINFQISGNNDAAISDGPTGYAVSVSSTGSGGGINFTRLQINSNNDTSNFTGKLTITGQNGFLAVSFDPIGNSTFSVPVAISTLTVSGIATLPSTISIGGTTYNWAAGIGSAGQCLTTNGATPIPTLTWGSCSGGGSTSFVLLEDGTDLLLEDGTKLLLE